MLYVTEYARRAFLEVASPKERKHRLSSGQQRRLIEKTANILERGEPTKFAFEAACRHALRSGLCTSGWRWSRADQAASEIVAAALRQLGTQRPTWYEGQLEHTGHEERLYCANPNCQRPIERDPEEYRHRIFCSADCRKSTQNLRYTQDHRAEAKAMSQSWRDAKREAAPEKPCENCARPFKPLVQSGGKRVQRFCGKSCATIWRNRKHPVRFGWMGPVRSKSRQPAASCLECGTTFRPKWKGNRFCGKLCSNRSNQRRAHQNTGMAPVMSCT